MFANLKRFALSLSFILLFALYALQRHIGTSEGGNLAVVPPQSAISRDQGSFGASANRNAVSVTYRDGTYVGDQADAGWGIVEVKAIVANGRISDVQFLQFPNHRSRSRSINHQATPLLTQEAIQSQSANVDIVSGATDTSYAFIQSLSTALSQAAA